MWINSSGFSSASIAPKNSKALGSVSLPWIELSASMAARFGPRRASTRVPLSISRFRALKGHIGRNSGRALGIALLFYLGVPAKSGLKQIFPHKGIDEGVMGRAV